MNKISPRTLPNPQKKYRQQQSSKGLVRYELQISNDAKQRFEALVKAAADEYPTPFSERQRMAKARIQIFNELTQGITHDFFTLQDQIHALKEQVAALSPSFFKIDAAKTTPIPDAIRALPDEPQSLKSLLTKLYTEGQHAKLAAKQYKQRADQFSELYELLQIQNETFRKQLKDAGLSPEE